MEIGRGQQGTCFSAMSHHAISAVGHLACTLLHLLLERCPHAPATAAYALSHPPTRYYYRNLSQLLPPYHLQPCHTTAAGLVSL